jgi:hypothetical protein
VLGSGCSPRRPRRAVLGLALAVLVSAPAAAQGVPAAPGPYVIDVHATSSGIPQAAAFLPPVSAEAPVPARGTGFGVGAHVYFFRLGAARVGFGATLMNVRGEAVPAQAAASASMSTTVTGPPGIAVDMRTLAPQVSFNFGTAEGWSYLSGGVGVSEVVARAIDVDIRRDTGRVMTINAGGGARWFISRHIAVGFDVRLHRLAAAETMPATMLFAVGGGISLR